MAASADGAVAPIDDLNAGVIAIAEIYRAAAAAEQQQDRHQ